MVVPVGWSRLIRTPRGWDGSLVGVRVDPPHFGWSGKPIVDLKSAAVITVGPTEEEGRRMPWSSCACRLTSARRGWSQDVRGVEGSRTQP